MNTNRFSHTATKLSDGRVLVAGGRTSLGMVGAAVRFHTATPLDDGRVLTVGGLEGLVKPPTAGARLFKIPQSPAAEDESSPVGRAKNLPTVLIAVGGAAFLAFVWLIFFRKSKSRAV